LFFAGKGREIFFEELEGVKDYKAVGFFYPYPCPSPASRGRE